MIIDMEEKIGCKGFVSVNDSIMIIISSPSGAGKTTIAKKLLSIDQKIKMSVSITTREKRPAEISNVDYIFIDKNQFENMSENGKLLEYAKVFDHYYGTPKDQVDSLIDQGYDVLFDIDWQGAQQISSKKFPNVIKIFILPPSIKELEYRLRMRGADGEDVIRRRMRKAREEISHYDEYDYVVINSNLEESVNMVCKIIEVERNKRSRIKNIKQFVESMIL